MIVTTVDQLENEGEPGWRVEQIIPESSMSLLYAERGVGKSFLALDWFLCSLIGKAWCGREVSVGQAWYIAGEGVDRMWPRVHAWKRQWGVTHGIGGRVVHGPVQFHRPSEVSLLLEHIDVNDEIVNFIVVDTVARCFLGGDENKAQDVGLWVGGIDRVRRATGADVLVIHHAGWSGTHERGSNALGAAADTVMRLFRKGEDELTLHCDRQKDGPEFEDIKLKLVGHEDSLVVVPGSPEPDILATLVKLGGKASRREWMQAAGVSQATWYRHVRKLREKSVITEDGENYRLNPSPS